jgi:hypothetical protein
LSKKNDVGRADVAASDQELADEIQNPAASENETAIEIIQAIGPVELAIAICR